MLWAAHVEVVTSAWGRGSSRNSTSVPGQRRDSGAHKQGGRDLVCFQVGITVQDVPTEAPLPTYKGTG